ncbi:hypothetical protein DPMN_017890 [Dreissena polymorpha]|uniref:Uncharacterized protein n=1 Tax=Dreissena polymorpha TaxID=45954 RepID=A0A9D4NG51_DREPO|nr:hypothetical protein DPMN_017890 [Dreissena polymorpha]
MPQSKIIWSPADDVSDLQASGRLDTFSAYCACDRPMIARKPGQFVASGGVRINFKSHLKFYLTLGPGRNQVEIETRSDDQRTGIARRSHDIGFIERVSAKVKVFYRGIYIGRRPSDCRRASARCPTDAGRCWL